MKLEKKTGSSRPYFIEATYKWLNDYGHTIYLCVNAQKEGVIVPQAYVNEDGTIILNISPHATQNLTIGKRWIRFQAQFSGESEHLEVPISAVLSISSKEENWRGISFDGEDPDLDDEDGDDGESVSSTDTFSKTSRKKPQHPFLKIIK